MQCILGLQGSFPCVECDKTAPWENRQRQRERKRGKHFKHAISQVDLIFFFSSHYLLREKTISLLSYRSLPNYTTEKIRDEGERETETERDNERKKANI